MPAFIIGSERNLTALTRAVVTDRVSPALSRRFADAVRAANPGVVFDRLEPGTVIDVPDVPGVPLRPSSPTFDTGRFGSARVLEQVLAALGDVVTAAERASADAEQEREQTLAVLLSGELKESGRGAERTGPTIAAAVKAIEEDRAMAARRAESLKAAHSEWAAELRGLSELIGS